MRKRKLGRKLSRKRDQRKALLKSLARALFVNERIKTTEAKAKETARFAEKLITIAKSTYRTESAITQARTGDLASRRYLLRFFSKNIVKKIVDKIAPRYKERKGGYTRIIKSGLRKSDGARMAIIELVK